MTKQLSFLPKIDRAATQEQLEGCWKVYVYISNLE